MTEKNKRQLRAEAIERLKNNVGARFMPDAAIIAIVGGRVGQSDWSLECDKLIDLLTDDDSHEEREGYEERMYDVPVSDCPYCGCDRVVIHEYNDSYERPHSYRVEHVDEKEAFNCDCFESYYGFDSIEKAVQHADMREGERNEHPKKMYVSGEDFEWLQEQLDDGPTNGIDGETNGIADGPPLADGLPEGDAVEILRKWANFWGVSHSTYTQCDSNWEVTTMRTLADMVERDYVSREVFEDLRDEFTWETTFLHRMGKKCGTKDVPSLVAYVGKLEARVEELEAVDCRIAETDARWEAAIRDLERMTAERDELKAKVDGYVEALEKLGCSVLANGTVFWPPDYGASCSELQKQVDELPVELDSREKLEADVSKYVHDAWAQGWEAGQHDDMDCCNFYVSDMRALLDRQEAITERELCKQCSWPTLAAMPDKEAYDRIAELQAKVDVLDIENSELCDEIAALNELRGELTRERDELREKLGNVLNGDRV